MVGLSVGDWKLELYDMAAHTQTELVSIQSAYPQWSHDGQWVHFVGGSGARTWYRVRVHDRKVEQLFAGKDAQRLIRERDLWTGTAPDDCVLTLRDAGTREIYALEWEAP
jgi:hypothetical protein